MTKPAELIRKIAEVSESISQGSGEPSIEFAGMMVSHFTAHPDDIETFMHEGIEMFFDGRIGSLTGCLSHRCNDGVVRSSETIRALHGAPAS